MNTKQILLTWLLTLFAVGIWADDSKIIVWFNNGDANVDIPFEKTPQFVYADGNISITVDDVKYTWPLAILKEFTFEKSLPTYIFMDTEDNGQAVLEKNAAKCAHRGTDPL